MGDPRAFMSVRRLENGCRPVQDRLRDYDEIEQPLPEDRRRLQASRCMDCGVPFCHWACPVGNLMPEWQDKVFRGDWRQAYEILRHTNSFPEFTGRLCPALCEASCVLGMNDEAVTIRQNELAVVERAFAEGYAGPRPPERRTGRRVAVIGSGPAGLACADSLNRAGHTVVVYEAADRAGGFLRYGVPDFKLDKSVIDRRVDILRQEGLCIETGVEVGRDVPVDEIRAKFDAVCLAVGCRKPRDLPVEGRELAGIHQATDYLEQQNRIVAGDQVRNADIITARHKHVVVIGGGDTGSDCIGTANRQGARSVTQIEILPAPPQTRGENEPWPLWPKLLKTSSSHEEGCERLFSVATRKFTGGGGSIHKLLAGRVEWQLGEKGRYVMAEVPGSEFELEAHLVILAMGFEQVVREGLVDALRLEHDPSGNIAVDDHHMTVVDGVFAAGDSRRGPSLVAMAIQDGQATAGHVDEWLGSASR